MRKFFFGLMLSVLWIPAARAADIPLRNGVGAGFQLGQYQDDFGVGLALTGPYMKGRLAVRVRGHLMFSEYVRDDRAEWEPYAQFTAGLIGVGGHVGPRIRLYGEGGALGLFPPAEFSDDDFVLGGYGVFGFEFFMDARRNYFIELGGAGTGARKDRLPGQPLFSNGMIVGAGFRITL